MLMVWCNAVGFGEDSAVVAEQEDDLDGRRSAAEEYALLLGEGVYTVHVCSEEEYCLQDAESCTKFEVVVSAEPALLAQATCVPNWGPEELTDIDIEIDLEYGVDWL
jgi:hypothetical protein